MLLKIRLCLDKGCWVLCVSRPKLSWCNLCKSDVQVHIYLKLLLIRSNPLVFLLIFTASHFLQNLWRVIPAKFFKRCPLWSFIQAKLLKACNLGSFLPFNFPNKLENRSSSPEVYLRKVVLKICSKFTAEQLCESVIFLKLC